MLGREGQIYVGVDGNYRSRLFVKPDAVHLRQYRRLRAYQLPRRFSDGQQASIFFGYVRNLFDVDYFEQLAVPSGNTGLIVGQPGDPRTYGDYAWP